MTLEEFFEKLEQTPRDWSVSSYGLLRREQYDPRTCCPIAAVCGETHFEFQSARNLGLTELDVLAIMGAADRNVEHDHNLRARLLKACGLS